MGLSFGSPIFYLYICNLKLKHLIIMNSNLNNPKFKEHFTGVVRKHTILKTYSHAEISGLIDFGRSYYGFLNKELQSGEYLNSGFTEMEVKVLLELVYTNMCELIKAQSEIEKYELLNICDLDSFVHLN